ncbi:MAG: hypothetical protein P4M01_03235 [Acidobacteriota bacterium]|nr:hypothetical protein [Acidobacteriota bacterium]
MNEPVQELDPARIASVRRRLGFVAFLWWIAALSGTLGLLQGRGAGWLRLTFLCVSWLFALLFTLGWWHIRKGKLSQ